MTFPVQHRPFRSEHSYEPQWGVPEQVNRANQQAESVRNELTTSFREDNAEDWRNVQRAKEAFRSLSEEARTGPEGQALQQVIRTWDRALRQSVDLNPRMIAARQAQGIARDSNITTEQREVEVVILRNRYVEAWIVPEWGGRLIRAYDPRTEVEYFARLEGTIDFKPWDAFGGVKASFPFFEHGLILSNPAAWRVVAGDDGSQTVAMDLRFTQHRQARDIARYGQYDASLTAPTAMTPLQVIMC
jgi:hypothetical protein